MRLFGGRSAYEGQVEVCLSQRWGSICDDGWTTEDVQVVCRQLGYSFNSTLSTTAEIPCKLPAAYTVFLQQYNYSLQILVISQVLILWGVVGQCG